MYDLGPATSELARLVRAVRDEHLDTPTPCAGMTVAGLLDHIAGLSVAFTAAATKTTLDEAASTPSAEPGRLAPDFRERIPARLEQLAQAWRSPDAWEGMSRAGGLDLPAPVVGRVAMDEVVVHGWDLAVSTGQDVAFTDESLTGAYEFVSAAAAQNPDGMPGLFGPPVPVPEDAPRLDRLVGLAGRDPAWRPGRP